MFPINPIIVNRFGDTEIFIITLALRSVNFVKITKHLMMIIKLLCLLMNFYASNNLKEEGPS